MSANGSNAYMQYEDGCAYNPPPGSCFTCPFEDCLLPLPNITARAIVTRYRFGVLREQGISDEHELAAALGVSKRTVVRMKAEVDNG